MEHAKVELLDQQLSGTKVSTPLLLKNVEQNEHFGVTC